MFIPKRILAVTLAVLALAAAGAGYWLDARLKAAEGWGYAPDNAQCVIYLPAIAESWRAWRETPTAEAAQATLARQLHEIPLFFRQTTGIRPTPLRVRAWLGDRTVIGVQASGDTLRWGLCVRPGLLLRAAHFLNRASGAAPLGDVFSYRGWHYAWRDGFLIASPDAEYVDAALAAPPAAPVTKVQTGELLAQWQGAYPGFLAARADGTLSFNAEWAASLPRMEVSRARPALLADSNHALLSISGGAPEPYLNWMTDAARPWHVSKWAHAAALLLPWVDSWFHPEQCAPQGVDAFGLTLYGLGIEQGYPQVEAVLSLRTTAPQQAHPLRACIQTDVEIPCAWNGQEGVLLPMAGAQWTFALQGRNTAWHCASRESVMARFLSNAVKDAPADFTLRLNWNKLAAALDTLAYQAAEQELLPWNTRELPGLLQPWTTFLAAGGALELAVNARGQYASARGHLNLRAAS